MIVTYPNNDIYSLNDTVYSYFNINFADEFAYTGAQSNDVEQAAGVTGKGLNLGGTKFGGFANPTGGANGSTTFQNHAIYTSHNNAYAGGRYWNY